MDTGLGYKFEIDRFKVRRALCAEILPKQLDEEVARYMVQGFGGVITRMTEKQAKYLGVPVEGPYKPHEYRY